jgi:hypothetical protein
MVIPNIAFWRDKDSSLTRGTFPELKVSGTTDLTAITEMRRILLEGVAGCDAMMKRCDAYGNYGNWKQENRYVANLEGTR